MNQSEQMTFEDWTQFLRRYWRLLLACSFACGLAAAVGSFIAKPVYEASVLVEVSSDSSQSLLSAMNPAFNQQQSRIFTYVELAQSRTILERICENFGLIGEKGKSEALARLRKNVGAKNVRNTDLISITVKDNDAKRACDMANALGAELVSMSIEKRQQESRRVREFLDTQVGKVREDLLKSEANLSPRAVRVNEEVYRLLLSKRHEANIAEHSEIGELAVVDPAAIPEKPVRPRKAINTILGLALGFLIGLAAASWHERQASGVGNVEELEELTKTSVLGTIPMSKINAGGDWLARPADLLQGKDKDGHLEAYRMVAANLELLPSEKRRKTILIASAVPGEGKSRTTACLGLAMAKQDRKIVVVEGDLRRPMLGGLWRLSGPGLAGLLSGKCSAKDAVRFPDPASPYFAVIPAGENVPSNPMDLFDSNNLQKVMGQLAGEYDTILIDSSPILLTPDVLKIAGTTDGVLMIVEAQNTPRKLIARALKQFERINVETIGLILNKHADHGSGYGGYGYGGYYGRYYRRREGEAKPV